MSPWFRGVFALDPDPDLMAGAPFLFQAHAVSAWLLFAVWPFSRLVHAWSIPLTYLGRSWILFRSRNPRAELARKRARLGIAVGIPQPGGTFWLRWRTLDGSQRRLSVCKHRNASTPNAACTRSIGSSACM